MRPSPERRRLIACLLVGLSWGVLLGRLVSLGLIWPLAFLGVPLLFAARLSRDVMLSPLGTLASSLVLGSGLCFGVLFATLFSGQVLGWPLVLGELMLLPGLLLGHLCRRHGGRPLWMRPVLAWSAGLGERRRLSLSSSDAA